ncbi:uncharacterized protein MONBRDRAFT_11626 [Monosiga brevicollis MX1]|uniref:Uncharacterized protein n=1 Tax=Monosiga brevicollis TaxID=81824 RepID=A9V9U2_MONBE|nr:uncharacterized protein MONBRDRAFT_11626 [Monosiga brevicollis MX1]EDQ85725.1 predicted protein [Monosiga brevicollis MX1]|eukprot:XP_001749440.1 hypothetical protein [Monosiga brevicollis MX1]
MKFTLVLLMALVAYASGKVCYGLYSTTDCSGSASQSDCIATATCVDTSHNADDDDSESAVIATCSDNTANLTMYGTTDCSDEGMAMSFPANECSTFMGGAIKITCSSFSASAAAGLAALGVVAALLF